MEISQPILQSQRHSSLPARLMFATGAIILIGIIAWPNFPAFGEDSDSYQKLMLNQWSSVHQPFSSRFLHAELIWLITRTLHVSMTHAVIGAAWASLLLTVLGVSWILSRLDAPAWFVVPVTVGCAFMQTFRLAYMPDLFYTLLLVGLFMLLICEQMLLAAAMLFLLFCARESTLVLGVTLIALSTRWFSPTARRSHASHTIAFAVATVLGYCFNRYVTSNSAGNMHEMSGILYIVGKVPFNFLKNVLGIAPWTNTLVATEGDNPLYRHAVPHWAHLGAIHQVGIAELSGRYPLRWLANTFCTFGIFFAVIFRQWAAYTLRARQPAGGRFNRLRSISIGFKDFLVNEPLYSRIALVYGLVSLLIVPLLGTAVHRYIYYAWPAFWITGVRLLQVHYLNTGEAKSTAAKLMLLALHLILVWLPLAVGWADASWVGLLLILLVAIVLQIASWKTLVILRLQPSSH